SARANVFFNPILDLVSTAGETREAFIARCTEMARSRAAQERAAAIAKHDPKIQKLAVRRDAARAAFQQAQGPLMFAARSVARADKLREKAGDAEAALAEAVAKRNADIASREAELAQAATEAAAREVVAKKDALTIEAFAIAWVAE